MNAQCEQYSHLIPDYCLGTLDASIRTEIEALLPDCPELAELVATYQVVAEPLLYSAPPATAPAHLLDNILRETRATAPKPQRLNFQSSFWRNIAAVLVICILFGASNFYWYQRNDELQQEVVTLNDALETNIVAQNQSLGNDALLQTNPYAYQQIPIGISMNNSQATNNISQINNYSPMNAANQLTTQADDALASLTWSQGSTLDSWIGIFSAQNFSLNTDASVYQLWLNREDAMPLSAGVFGVDNFGNGLLVFEVEEPIESFDTISVTTEPLDGSFSPTTDPVISADLHNWTNLP